MSKILSVGQCNPDQSAIERAIVSRFQAEISSASTLAEARARINQEDYDLILVNRVFDATAESGLGLIEEVSAQTDPPPVMLVSNFADAQEHATSLGAMPGFGKQELGSDKMIEALKSALQVETTDPSGA